MSDNQRIDELEKEVLGIGFQLSNQGKVLEDIKNILVKQSEILADVAAIRHGVNQVRSDVDQLETIFEKRKEVTDQNNKDFAAFSNWAKGALAVCAVIFGIVQTTVYDSFNNNQAEHKELRVEIKQLQKQVTVLEAAKPTQERTRIAPVASE